MKPTSIIFIIVSVILACLGVLLCTTASNMATEEGTGIFSQTGDADNNFISTHEFDSSTLQKIVINVSDVDVNIYGGAAKDMIELVNFASGTYDYALSKSTLQLSDNNGITSIVDIDNFKINFNGFRDYLHYYKYCGKARTINLYVTDAASVKIMNVTSDSGNVTMNNLHLNRSLDDGKCYCDYKIIVGTGDVYISHLETESTVQIESTVDSRVDVLGMECNELKLNAVNGYITLKNLTLTHALRVAVKSGTVDYDRTEPNFADFNVLLQVKSGTLRLNGNKISSGLYTEENIRIVDPEDTDDTDDSGEETEEKTPVIDPNAVSIVVDEGSIEVY